MVKGGGERGLTVARGGHLGKRAGTLGGADAERLGRAGRHSAQCREGGEQSERLHLLLNQWMGRKMVIKMVASVALCKCMARAWGGCWQPGRS